MAIVVAADILQRDSRFRSWTKKISAQTIDLRQEGAYALTSDFHGYDKAVALEAGEYLVVAAEQGSRRNVAYKYALVGPDGEKIGKEAREPVLVWARERGLISQAQEAKMQNSLPYTYAVYVAMDLKQAEGEPKAMPPEGITAADWAATPAAVRDLVLQLLETRVCQQ